MPLFCLHRKRQKELSTKSITHVSCRIFFLPASSAVFPCGSPSVPRNQEKAKKTTNTVEIFILAGRWVLVLDSIWKKNVKCLLCLYVYFFFTEFPKNYTEVISQKELQEAVLQARAPRVKDCKYTIISFSNSQFTTNVSSERTSKKMVSDIALHKNATFLRSISETSDTKKLKSLLLSSKNTSLKFLVLLVKDFIYKKIPLELSAEERQRLATYKARIRAVATLGAKKTRY